MQLDRIMIWKFAEAPPELRALNTNPEAPEWLALVPKALNSPDIDAAIQKHAGEGVLRFETSGGDAVYIGGSPLVAAIGSSARSGEEGKRTLRHTSGS